MSAEFKKATEDSKKLKSTPNNDQLLEVLLTGHRVPERH
jgi:acyl-CoA-binding protein